MQLCLFVVLAIFGSQSLALYLSESHREMRNSCPGQCVMQDKYRNWLMEMLPKARDFGKQLAEGNNAPVIPTMPVEKFDTYCSEVNEIKTCINNCNVAGQEDMKNKASTIINKLSEVVCNTNVKTIYPCMTQVAQERSETCDNQCNEHKQPIIDAYNKYKTTGTRDWQEAKRAGSSLCKLVNCRLTCRKNDIIEKCEEDGYNKAKDLLKSFADLGQTVHSQFRDPNNFPDECKPDNIIANA